MDLARAESIIRQPVHYMFNLDPLSFLIAKEPLLQIGIDQSFVNYQATML